MVPCRLNSGSVAFGNELLQRPDQILANSVRNFGGILKKLLKSLDIGHAKKAQIFCKCTQRSAARDQESDSEFRDLIVDLGRSSLEGVPHWLKIDNRQSKIDNVVVSVAQLDRASDFGSEGCGFESLQARKSGPITLRRSLTLRLPIDYESQ